MRINLPLVSLAWIAGVVGPCWLCACSGDASLGYDRDASADACKDATVADVGPTQDSTNSDTGYPQGDSQSPQSQDSERPDASASPVGVDAEAGPDTGAGGDATVADVMPPQDSGVPDVESPPDVTEAASCSVVECIRAVECATSCDGPALTNGCCPCPAGMVDWSTCAVDAGPAVDASDGSCPIPECDNGYVCTAYCGGPVFSSGCCACPAGSFDVFGLRCDSADGGQTPSTEAGEDGGADASGDGGASAGLNTACHLGADAADGACPYGLTAMTFYAAAGPAGVQFCLCSIPCSMDASTCPAPTQCAAVSDGVPEHCY